MKAYCLIAKNNYFCVDIRIRVKPYYIFKLNYEHN